MGQAFRKGRSQIDFAPMQRSHPRPMRPHLIDGLAQPSEVTRSARRLVVGEFDARQRSRLGPQLVPSSAQPGDGSRVGPIGATYTAQVTKRPAAGRHKEGDRHTREPPLIRIISLNTKLLPAASPTVADDLARWLLEQACDVICLQEVFSGTATTVLQERLRPSHPHLVLPHRVLVEDNGLFIASRFPFAASPVHVMWEATDHLHERLSSKGFTFVAVDLFDSAAPIRLGLVNLHMHSNYDSDDAAPVRTLQLEQLRRALPSLLRPADNLPLGLVVLGDFNVAAEDDGLRVRDEYTAMLERLGRPCDLFRDFDRVDPGHTCDRDRIDLALAFRRLDALDLVPLHASAASVCDAPYSDHRALRVDLARGLPPQGLDPSQPNSAPSGPRAASPVSRGPLPSGSRASLRALGLDALLETLLADPALLEVLANADRRKRPSADPVTHLRIAAPKDLRGLTEVIEAAHTLPAGRRFIKAVGTERSTSGIRTTVGVKLSMTDYARVERDAGTGRTAFQAGARIGAINTVQQAAGRTLINQPGSAQLTYVGCMSVGGHGSGTTRRALAGHARAICLMGHDGHRVTHYQIEPSGSELPLLQHDATRWADDALFRACTVNIGMLGTVTAVAVDNEPAYNIREHRWEANPAQDLTSLVAALVAWNDKDDEDDVVGGVSRGKPHSFELWLDPYSRRTIVGQRWRTRDDLRGARPFALSFNGWGSLEWLMNELDESQRLHLAPKVIANALGLVTKDSDYVLPPAQGLDFGANNGLDMLTCAVAVPTRRCVEAIDLIANVCREMAKRSIYLSSPVGVRFAKGYSATTHPWLAPQFGELTTMIELAGFRQVRCSNEALSRLMRELADHCGARLHWGQTLPDWFDGAALRRMYPQDAIAAFVAARRQLDPTNLYGNALSKKLLLDP